MKNHVVVIGAGPAGLETAAGLSRRNCRVTILEKQDRPGGKLNNWHLLFPDFTNAGELSKSLSINLLSDNADIRYGTEVYKIKQVRDHLLLSLNNNTGLEADAVVMAMGFVPFDATRKEEYGYGIYRNVITSSDLETMLADMRLPGHLLTGQPVSIGLVHCVGSRDKKAGNLYCSRLCCATGVKQAIEIRQLLPCSRVSNFYMDLRMHGLRWEELYQQAQEKYRVNFIRGRVSEIAEMQDGRLLVKAEDTLSHRPLKMIFDLVVLLTGMTPARESAGLLESIGVPVGSNGYPEPLNQQVSVNETVVPGIFLAGTCREPLSLQETLSDARATSVKVYEWLSMKELIHHE